MTPAPAAPLLVRLEGRKVVGVGGGRVAAGKLAPLARDHGARVVVIAPQLAPELADLVTWEQRRYAGAADLRDAALVVAATPDPATNAQVMRDAKQLGAWCVRTDEAEAGSAAIPATVRRGPLLLSVSTDGRSPTVSRWLRQQLEETYGPEYGDLVQLLGALRDDPEIAGRLAGLEAEQRRRAWRSIPLADILAHLRSGSVETAKEVAAACLSSFSD